MKCPNCESPNGESREMDELGDVRTLSVAGHWCRHCGTFLSDGGRASVPSETDRENTIECGECRGRVPL